MTTTRWIPWAVGALALAGALAGLRPQPPVRGFDVEGFGRLPILEGGRVKPIDSLARNSLLLIRGQQSFAWDDTTQSPPVRRTVGATEWLLDVLFRPQVADQQPVFVINDPEVLGLIGRQQTADRYFSFATLAPHVEELQRQYLMAQPIDAKARNRFQGAVVNLFDRVYLYYRLKNSLQAERSAGLLVEVAAATTAGAEGRHRALAETAHFRPFGPADVTGGEWLNSGEALRSAARGARHPALLAWARLGLAWGVQDPATFDRNVAEALAVAGAEVPEGLAQAGHELVFNRAQPFYVGMVLYVLALLAVFASWLKWPEPLRGAAFAFLAVGALVHTAGLVSRVILQGRPPVTNLYSSAVFVGWGAVLLGVVVERMYRRGFGTAVAAASGFASLIVAHHLSGDGDTMEMMRAVLDSNFWLATHVVTITIGYSGTFLAGAIAIGYGVYKHVAARVDEVTVRTLLGAAYGVICFALFFSFLGTVLGGIWADQSWGRFWGWDPKENGALLIVLWNAIILHARWGGYARERGIMAMAIFGNVVTAASWFGVNMLGVGLHSYGFMDKAFWALTGFSASQLLFMGLVLAPRRFGLERGAAAPGAGPDGPGRPAAESA